MSSTVNDINTATKVSTPKEQNTFTRIEDKFFIKAEYFNTFFSVINERLEPCYPDKNTKFTLIESSYFDSNGMDIYKNHFKKNQERFKLRTRRYGPDGTWAADDLFLELKLKHHGISMKERLAVSTSDILAIQNGKGIELSDTLLQKNNKTKPKKIEKRLHRINRLISLFHLQPQCAVTYKRFAFENNGFRVTIDSKIQSELLHQISPSTVVDIFGGESWSQALQMRNMFLQEEYYLVEVKHSGSIPQWCQVLLGICGARKASFSKYCFSITNALSESKGKVK